MLRSRDMQGHSDKNCRGTCHIELYSALAFAPLDLHLLFSELALGSLALALAGILHFLSKLVFSYLVQLDRTNTGFGGRPEERDGIAGLPVGGSSTAVPLKPCTLRSIPKYLAVGPTDIRLSALRIKDAALHTKSVLNAAADAMDGGEREKGGGGMLRKERVTRH